MRVLLLGGRGQLAADIRRRWTRHEVVPLTHEECDVTDAATVQQALRTHGPDVVLNCAAYHRVDDCEGPGAVAAWSVNVLGAKNVADACREQAAACLFVSTDYVFDGLADEPYREDHPPAPVSIYGISKAAGEQAVRYACSRHYIVRTSGLYGVAGASGRGGNFVETMLRLAREGEAIRVVDDQTLAPTSTADLASALELLVATEAFGTYHVTNAGACTWRQFAATIFELAGVEADLRPTTTEAYGAPARRPSYSVLANERIGDVNIQQPRSWREALEAYLVAKGHR